MCSVPADDRTARARIRDAAIARVAADGFARATVRRVAADAGFSPGLVLHHFGSKEGLRQACDEYVVSTAASWVEPLLTSAAQPGALAELLAGAGELVGYVRRALVEGGAGAEELVDRFVAATERLLVSAQEQGTVRASADDRARAAALVLWDLSALLLGAHLRRVLGEDDERAALARYGEAAAEVFSDGLFRRPDLPGGGEDAPT